MLYYRNDEIAKIEKQRVEEICEILGVTGGSGLLRLLMRITNQALNLPDNIFYPMVRGRLPEEDRALEKLIPAAYLAKLEEAIKLMVEAAQQPGNIISAQRRKKR